MIRVIPEAAVRITDLLSPILLSNSLSKPDLNLNNNSSYNHNQELLY